MEFMGTYRGFDIYKSRGCRTIYYRIEYENGLFDSLADIQIIIRKRLTIIEIGGE